MKLKIKRKYTITMILANILVLTFLILVSKKDNILLKLNNYFSGAPGSNFQDVLSVTSNLVILLLGLIIAISTVLLTLENKIILELIAKMNKSYIIYKSTRISILALSTTLVLVITMYIITGIPWYIKLLCVILATNLLVISVYRLIILYKILNCALKERFENKIPKQHEKIVFKK